MTLRICPRDGFEMILDVETARTAAEAGYPAVELYSCRLGHSLRVWEPDELAARRQARQGRRPCAVCGLWLPENSGRRGVHVGECTRFRNRAYVEFTKAHPGEPFLLEAQPWYRGILAPLPAPLPPLDPLAGRIPTDWAEGYLRLYGGEAPEQAA